MNNRANSSLISAIAVTTLVTVGSMTAYAETWNMPVPYGDNNFHTLNHVEFGKQLERATNGEITVKVHPSGSLFKHGEIKNAIRSGQAPIGEFLLSRLSNESPVFGMDSVPFLANSYADAKKLWDIQRPAVEKLLESQGLKVMYAVPWPPQGLYAKRSIEKLDDISGLKFRAYNAATERLAQLAKAVPTQVEVADLAQAFSTGRVDAMVTSPSTGYNNKAWDYLSNYYDVQAWLPKNIVVVNKRSFDRLTPDQQQKVMFAAGAAEARGWAASQGETKTKTDGLQENGITVAEPSDALRNALVEIGATMTEEWLASAGEEGKKLIELFNK